MSNPPQVPSGPAARAGAITVGGDVTFGRLGFGAMRITGPGVWGRPVDPDACIAVLRRAVELGVTFLDTADSYGPGVSEALIATALHPYPDDLVIATKAGLLRDGPSQWRPSGDPAHLRRACEGSLRRLKLERIPLYQLHRIDPWIPVEESIGCLLELQAEGKIAHIGLSEVGVDEIEHVRTLAPVVSVQNRYNLADRTWDDVVDHCDATGLAFIAYFPLGTRGTAELAQPGTGLDAVAGVHDATPAQVALAWLLARSPSIVPIPGTSSVAHLEENVGGAAITLTPDDLAALA